MATEEEIRTALAEVMDPELGRSIVELDMVQDVQIEGGCVTFTLALTTMGCPLKERIQADATQAVMALEGVRSVEIHLAEMRAEDKARIMSMDMPPEAPTLAQHMSHVTHVVAVMSGKGGVGKSLVSGLLATSLRRSGYRVGVLDADITGPSIPKMFFENGARPGFGPLGIYPAETRTGIKVMSINLVLETEDQPVIWRGPIISGAIRQFWTEVIWGDLDYLIVDLPPGTSDASLTVLQSLPLSGVLLVSSPQDLAGMVVRKAADMVQRVGVPLLGLVENMSYFLCPDTGKRHEIFGPSRADQLAGMLGAPLLGRLPIDPEITRLCDGGAIEAHKGDAFRPIAQQVIELAAPAQAAVFAGA